MINTDGLGVITENDGGTAPVNTFDGGVAPAPRGPGMRPGTGLEWIPRTVVKGALGQDPSDSLVGMVVRSIVSGVSGTVVGLALAPGHDKRMKYAVIGGLLGTFLGPLGIAGQAVYVLAKE